MGSNQPEAKLGDSEEYEQLTREKLLAEIKRIEGFGEVLATAFGATRSAAERLDLREFFKAIADATGACEKVVEEHVAGDSASDATLNSVALALRSINENINELLANAYMAERLRGRVT